MAIRVLKPGLQTSIQSAPRRGLRHLGVPECGAADRLSLALANRLLGNDLLAAALEATLVGPHLRFERDAQFALAGATATVTLNNVPIECHRTLNAMAGDVLRVGSIAAGNRIYIAFSGGLQGDSVFGSDSTYVPAGFGGHRGRALALDDVVQLAETYSYRPVLQTPENFRPQVSNRYALRVCASGETDHLFERQQLFDTTWRIGHRADRMGLQLDGETLRIESSGRMQSAPVFPGTIQCPENGVPFLLSVDAQTTGGYPRVAQVIRADRQLLGQLRAGDHLLLLPRQPAEAADVLRAMHAFWRGWLPGIERVI